MGIKEVWSSIKSQIICQLLLAAVFIISGLIINFLQFVTYLLVWNWNKDLYRKIVCNLAYWHWCEMVWIGQWWSGSDCTLHVEDEDILNHVGQEHTIVIMNHKYDIDWLMTWILAERFGLLGGTKVYGKSSLRFVPLIGWAWIFVESVFLYRNWDKDRDIITKGVQALTEYPRNCWVTLLLFPEGTRFTEHKHKQSMEVARKKGMPELKHHLLPRAKGFVQTMFALKECNTKIDAIYDLTVGFRPEGAEPNLVSIIGGKATKGEIYARRIPIEDVPTETEEQCAEWLQKLFREKDEIYDNFLQNGRFTIGTKKEVPARLNDFFTTMFWIFLIGYPFVKYILGVILSGSITTILYTVGGFFILSVGIKMFISVTEIEKGSSYGDDGKNVANNNKKKEE